MNTSYKQFLPALGAFALTLSLAPVVGAECGGLSQPFAKHVNWSTQSAQPRLLRAAYTSTDAQEDDAAPAVSIVGFWHVKFIAEGDKGIPDGTEIDAGYSQWHSDGTEIMNSGGRAPDTSSFCLGVWEKVGARTYKLNHFAVGWDTVKNELIGPGNVKEEVTLGPSGEHFAGTFTIDQFDESGNLLVHIAGKVTGDRIGVNTPPSSIF
jgi:hypothetical protein